MVLLAVGFIVLGLYLSQLVYLIIVYMIVLIGVVPSLSVYLNHVKHTRGLKILEIDRGMYKCQWVENHSEIAFGVNDIQKVELYECDPKWRVRNSIFELGYSCIHLNSGETILVSVFQGFEHDHEVVGVNYNWVSLPYINKELLQRE